MAETNAVATKRDPLAELRTILENLEPWTEKHSGPGDRWAPFAKP